MPSRLIRHCRRALARIGRFILGWSKEPWRSHGWAIGRETMLERMASDEERWAWLRARDEEDRLYMAYRRRSDPTYKHPWAVDR